MRLVLLAVPALFVCASAEAHVRIVPAESKVATTETYNARVPTEGKVTTTSVQLDVPDGVAIESASAPSGASYELKKDITSARFDEPTCVAMLARVVTCAAQPPPHSVLHYDNDLRVIPGERLPSRRS